MTLYGTSVDPEPGETYPQALARTRNMLGDVPIYRTYSRSRIGSPNQNSDPLCRATGAVTAYSFKTWDEAEVRAWLRDPANHGGLLTYFHEPEDNIARGELSAVDFRSRTIVLSRLIREEGVVGKVRPAINLMSWTLNPKSNRDLSDYVTDEVAAALADASGLLTWDAYGGDTTDRDPVTMYARCALTSAGLGLPWAILETGARTAAAAGDVALDAEHARWWRRALSFAADPAAFDVDVDPAWCVLLWNAQTADYDSRINTMPQTIEVWREFIANNGPDSDDRFTAADVEAARAAGYAGGYAAGHAAGRAEGFTAGAEEGFTAGVADEYDRMVAWSRQTFMPPVR